jgi:16S rRNA (cytidine1402-2'-O)-methyltransferase
MSTLSVVATPIGNLEDITLRALRILREADLVLCEDTRVTAHLLAHHGIEAKGRLASFPSNERALPTGRDGVSGVSGGARKAVDVLAEGGHVALVSDAGTPGISDPGGTFVSLVAERLPETKIEAIPGASALAAAVSIAGVPSPSFTFYGFLPHKKGRETILKGIAADDRASVFYESPHRIGKALAALAEFAPDRQIALARELTKVFEEVARGTAAELLARIEADPNKARGEFVAVVAAR